jgi:hypothetical protein
MLKELNMKWVISVKSLDYLLLLLPELIGRSLINFLERHLLYIIILIRKENLISLQLQRIFLKNSRVPRRRRNLNLKNISLKENVSTVENHDILLINALSLPKRLIKRLML